ncbi:MAG: Glutathione S-transferase, N-terminal domain [Pseudomonadota bacterium]|jgi:hypothetical protein
MTTTGSTLFWTVDSPFCRIVLWALCESNDELVLPVHLSWTDLNDKLVAEKRLGPERTVPCLSEHQSMITSDSLRILASLQKESFLEWLMSLDGALYRCCEGQWGRVMYSLYDGLEQNKVRPLWLQAIESTERLVNLHDEKQHDLLKVSLGKIALHTFASFVVGLMPEWRSDMPKSLKQLLASLEQTASFAKMQAHLNTQHHLIRCDAFSRSVAEECSSTEEAR